MRLADAHVVTFRWRLLIVVVALLPVSAQCVAQARPTPQQLSTPAPVNLGVAADFSREVLMTHPELRPGELGIQPMHARRTDHLRPSMQQLECGLPEQEGLTPVERRLRTRKCTGAGDEELIK
jgi:anti-sigma-K factor RskA